MFIAVFFIIVTNWKQFYYPSTDAWINKYLYSVRFHLCEIVEQAKLT